MEMHWKDGKVSKVVIKSTLGGNLRMRVPNELTSSSKGALSAASGENVNPFYFVADTAPPVVNQNLVITAPNLSPTVLYDFKTEAGKVYTFVVK